MNVFYVRVTRSVKDENLRLRPLRISDGHFIHRGLKNETCFRTNGLSRLIDSSWLSVWWWMKKTYCYSFCMEVDSRPIGFIGLYNLAPGKSAYISLVIFDETFRRQGYGTRSFKLFAQILRRHSVMQKLFITVKADNPRALSFWKKLGFSELNVDNDISTMQIDLDYFGDSVDNPVDSQKRKRAYEE